MATPAREISEGTPTDKRIFAPPPANQQDEAPRYICFMGSLIEPQTAVERTWTRGGGMEIENPCLRVVQHFIRKGRITPVLMDTHNYLRHDFVKKHLDIEPTQAGYFHRAIPTGYVAPTNEIGVQSPVGDYVGRVAYPGQQMEAILIGPENIHGGQRRGVLELIPLRGQPYRPQRFDDGTFVDPVIREMQHVIFPDYPFFLKDGQPTVLLDDLEEILDRAAEHATFRSIVDIYHESLTQFRAYAFSTIQRVHTVMREIGSKTAGYVPEYTAMNLVLLEQLGMDREDRAIRRQAKAESSDVSDLVSTFKSFIESQAAEREAMTALLKRQQPDTSTMAAAPIKTVAVKTAETKEQLPCECGKYTGTANGLRMHKTIHCELREVKASG